MSHSGVLKEKIACIDTSFILGDILSLAEEYREKPKKKRQQGITIKPSRRLTEILESGTRLAITPIVKYQILEHLIFDRNLKLEEANRIYLAILDKYKNLFELKPKAKDKNTLPDILPDALIYKALSKHSKVDLHDLLNIGIAMQAEMPIITSERKAQMWKSIYEKALSQEEAWELFRKEI